MSEDKPFQSDRQVVMVGEKKDIEVVIPRLTLKKIMAVTGSVDRLVKSAKEKSPELFDLFTKDGVENKNLAVELVKLTPTILPIILQDVIDILSIYLDKPKEFIEDMDVADLVAVATPFFVDISKQGNHLLGPLGSLFQKSATSQPQSENSSTSSEPTTDGQ